MVVLFIIKKWDVLARHWWLTPVILATQEAEISKIAVRSQPLQIVFKTLSRKYPSQKGLVEWLKVKALSSSPSTAKKKKEREGGGMFFCIDLQCTDFFV
jgi:hypothetical protein